MKTPVMHVSHFDGDVTIALPPALARDLASLWGQAHAADPILGATRPDWHLDVVALLTAAENAQQHVDRQPVLVPFLTLDGDTPPAPTHLQVVNP